VKVWMIGARGTIATTVAAGTFAARRGLLPLEGVLTETLPFRGAALPRIQEIEFGGCDLHPGDLAEAARANAGMVGVFPPAVLDAVAPDLQRGRITRGMQRGGGAAVAALDEESMNARPTEAARPAADRIAQDLVDFAVGEPAVVVNLASTEPLLDPAVLEWDLDALERAIDLDDPRIPASVLYAYAALRAGIPYINFTPSAGASLPALIELALESGLPLAGRDGKTGETLIKTALAPMFAIRALTVEGWYGTNILGNTDGRVLADPANRASKVASKKGVLEGCLGYQPEGDVRIDYFPPLADHKVAWDFIQFRGWGGHRMRMQFTWEGTDAALAAPLILDLTRLVTLAHRRGEAGPVGALGLFFKSPEGTTETNLHRQYEALLAWIQDTSGADADEPPREHRLPTSERRAS
jgi:myo-inositol-1-phosphate synthase